MYTVEYEGINSLLVDMSKILLQDGVERSTRGHKCWELPEPIMIKIINPLSRWITLPVRKWNTFLPYAESLQLACGRNDLAFLEFYLPKMKDFSDDGCFLRGGYGPRLRFYNGNETDYEVSERGNNFSFMNKTIDQFLFIVEKFNQDPYTRQAIISIGDPVKDCFNTTNQLKETKDFPCTRTLQFMRNVATNKLDLTVYLRSNDFIWGATGVNIFNFTFIQEYIAQILNLDVGAYYHIVNNMHYYEYHRELIEEISQTGDVLDKSFTYKKTFRSLSDFDKNIENLIRWENLYRKGQVNHIEDFQDDFFNDWAKILGLKIGSERQTFHNPILNELTNRFT
jgi:Thymidylate synthase